MVNLFRLHWDTEIAGSFKQSGRWRERQTLKKRVLIGKTIILHMHQAFFFFLFLHCTKTWKCLVIIRFVEDVNTSQRFSLSFPDLSIQSFRNNSTPKIVANIWQIERDWISAIKLKAWRLHFFKWRFGSRRRPSSLKLTQIGCVLSPDHARPIF